MKRLYLGSRRRFARSKGITVALLAAAGAFATPLPASEVTANTEARKPVASKSSESASPPVENKVGTFLQDLLPIPWQKRPKLRFHVFTEMTPEGRTWRVPTVQEPLHYFSPPGTYAETGWLVAAGEKPPPWQELQESVQKALAANGYVSIANDQQRPDLLVVFTFGAHGTDLAQLADDTDVPATAEELVNWALSDPAAIRDVIERARFIGGARIADQLATALQEEAKNRETNRSMRMHVLPVNPDAGSPFQLLLHFGETDVTRHIVELAFHSCYFVTATAYDFAGVERKQKRPLWQTRMTVEALGVSMREVLPPLIVATGPALGRETPEAIVVDKRINRQGTVEIGTPTVIEDNAPRDAKDKAAK